MFSPLWIFLHQDFMGQHRNRMFFDIAEAVSKKTGKYEVNFIDAEKQGNNCICMEISLLKRSMMNMHSRVIRPKTCSVIRPNTLCQALLFLSNIWPYYPQ